MIDFVESYYDGAVVVCLSLDYAMQPCNLEIAWLYCAF